MKHEEDKEIEQDGECNVKDGFNIRERVKIKQEDFFQWLPSNTKMGKQKNKTNMKDAQVLLNNDDTRDTVTRGKEMWERTITMVNWKRKRRYDSRRMGQAHQKFNK